MAEILTDLNRLFERNVQLNRLNVDFLLEGNIVIECYGDYWHCNPRSFQASDYQKSLHLTAEEKWKKDRDRVDSLTRQGYLVLCLWEYDIYNFTDEVIVGLKEVLGQKMPRRQVEDGTERH